MNKKELLKLVESIDDEGSVDEVLSGSDFAKSLLQSGLTLNAFKEKINEPEFKSYLDSVKDKHFDKALETWKSNNLQTIINDEVLRATGKKKTPEQIKIEELQRKFDEQEKENTRLKNQSTVKSMMNSYELDPEKYFAYIGTDDMENVKTKIENLKAMIKDDASKIAKEQIASGGYTPPGENGAGDLTVDDIAKMMM